MIESLKILTVFCSNLRKVEKEDRGHKVAVVKEL